MATSVIYILLSVFVTNKHMYYTRVNNTLPPRRRYRPTRYSVRLSILMQGLRLIRILWIVQDV